MNKRHQNRNQLLHWIINLALKYRRWNKAELARHIGVHAANLFRGNWDRSVEFYVRLSEALEWPLEATVVHVMGVDQEANEEHSDGVYSKIDDAVMKAYDRGNFRRMARLAQNLQVAAATPAERAVALNRLCSAFDGLGLYARALNAAQRGLQEVAIPADVRLKLQVNLAHAHYALWELSEAQGIAGMVSVWYRKNRATGRGERGCEAFAYYVLGQACRRFMACDGMDRGDYAKQARSALQRSIELFDPICENEQDNVAGIINTCRGGLIEVEVELGFENADAAVDYVLDSLPDLSDPERGPVGSMLESWGWWSVSGGNIALRHLRGARLQKVMARLTMTADEIASRLDNWSLRERLYFMEYQEHRAAVKETGRDIPFVLTKDDLRSVVGLMGRFPSFCPLAWQMLNEASICDN